jgi:hypothetical protein
MTKTHDWTEADDATILAGRAANESYKSIGAKIGLSKNAVISRARTLGCPKGENPVSGDRGLPFNFDHVHRMRVVNGMPWEQIGSIVDYPADNVAAWYRNQCINRGIQLTTVRREPRAVEYTRKPRPVAVSQPREARAWHSVFTFRQNGGEVQYTPPPAPIEGGTLYEFMDRGCCQWMLNDAWPWRACGLPQRRGVYCVAHHADAYPLRKGREAA